MREYCIICFVFNFYGIFLFFKWNLAEKLKEQCVLFSFNKQVWALQNSCDSSSSFFALHEFIHGSSYRWDERIWENSQLYCYAILIHPFHLNDKLNKCVTYIHWWTLKPSCHDLWLSIVHMFLGERYLLKVWLEDK